MTKERPILFSGPMVRAILDGRKTQTRRVVKPQPTHMKWDGETPRVMMEPRTDWQLRPCPYGEPGDRLWVRETWGIGQQCKDGPDIWYKATEDRCAPRWKPSIHMPRAYSQLTLEICAVSVERLQDISGEEACAEGAPFLACYGPGCIDGPQGCNARGCFGKRDWFRYLWDALNPTRGQGWDANPWVWKITFRRLEA